MAMKTIIFFQPALNLIANDDLDSSLTEEESRTIKFVEKCTVISDRRRKTMKPPRISRAEDHEEDPELAEILSLGEADVEMAECQLPQLLALAMASIIDDAAESCCIMSKTFGLPDQDVDMTQKTLHERNELLRSHSTLFNPDTLEEYSKTQNVYMMRKLHADIVFLQNILSKCVKNLLMDNNYLSWYIYIDKYDLQLEQDAKLLDMVQAKTKKLHALKEQLHADKLQFLQDIDNLTSTIGKARDEMEDFIIQSEIKEAYLGNWEKSRREQNLRVKKENEEMFETKIDKLQKDIKKESRVHAEIESYMTEYFKDTEDSIQDWMNKYDKDIETKDEEILKLGFDIEALDNDLTQLKEEFQRHEDEMQDWLERKAEKQRIEEEWRFLNEMATRIQAWWRGTMVRRKLGPYRPKKKHKKNKNKKK